MARLGEPSIDWERLERLFEELAPCAAAERAARLSELRESDAALAGELASLLTCAPLADRLFRRLPLALAAAAGELVRPDSDGSAPARAPGPRTERHPGGIVAQYEIGNELGRGGMGVVYHAMDTRLNRPVALKFLPPHLWVDRAARERLLLEARAAAALDHANICTLYEVGETSDGALFLAMAFYEGETLRERLSRGPVQIDAAVDLASQAARALAAAHARGIVHRDVKPANLMLTSAGTVKLLDFGLARSPDLLETDSGLTPGTVAYMSPEQVRSEPVDARTDLWALGVVLFEMLTGRRPFRGHSEAEVIHGIVHDDAPLPSRLRADVPARLDDIVGRLLERDRERRYPSATALLEDLEHFDRSEHRARRPPPASAAPAPRRVRPGVAGLLAGLMVVTVAAGLLARRPDRSPRDARAVVDPDTRRRPIALAVLPLRNHSGDSAQEFFADGMTDELTSTLSKIEALRVIAHQSVRQFKLSEQPIPEIARILAVTHVVDGSVLQDGDSVQITVSLVDAATNTHVWGQSFRRDRRGVMSLQREVALAIVGGVAVALTPQDRERLHHTPPVDPDAFDLYVKGTQARYTLDPMGHDASDAADYFARAIVRDSAYAPAYAGLAAVSAYGNDARGARQLAERALALDPRLAEAHVVLGEIREWYESDWAGSEEAFRQAIRLQPGHAEAHHVLSMRLLRGRRFEEALTAAQRALYLAPTSARFQHGLGEVYYFGGRYEDAARAAAAARALDSTWSGTDLLSGVVHAELGEYDDAVAALERFSSRVGDVCAGSLGYVYAVSGRRERALELLKTCEARVTGPHAGWTALGVATIHAGLGHRQDALRWLERVVEMRPMVGVYLAVDPQLRSLRGEPRFQALLRRVGLAP